jgi:hypothetical protein
MSKTRATKTELRDVPFAGMSGNLAYKDPPLSQDHPGLQDPSRVD